MDVLWTKTTRNCLIWACNTVRHEGEGVLVTNQASCHGIFTAAGLLPVEAIWTEAFFEAFCDVGKLKIANRLQVDVRQFCDQG